MHDGHPGLGSPVLLVVSVLLGAWGTATAEFLKRFHMTPYAENKKWLLALLWPILVLISSEFRGQFLDMLKGSRRSMGREEEERRNGPDDGGSTVQGTSGQL